MLDDLREQASDSDFFDGEEGSFDYSEKTKAKGVSRYFLGMTPIQRFVIAFMILMMVVIMGSLFLLITEKIYLPI